MSVNDGSNGLTEQQRETLRTKLLEARATLVGECEAREGELRGQQDTAAEAMDAAEQARAQAEALQRAERDRQRLRAIDDALARFEDGTYGISAVSGEPISVERLMSIPWATLSVQDQEELERRNR